MTTCLGVCITRPATDRTRPDHVAAPSVGVVTTTVDEEDVIETGHAVATIEAVKMDAAITATHDGTVTRIAVSCTAPGDGGDLLVVTTAHAGTGAGPGHRAVAKPQSRPR